MTATLLLAAILVADPQPTVFDAEPFDRSRTSDWTAPPQPLEPTHAGVAAAMRDALEASLRWHGSADSTIAPLASAVESIVLAAAPTRLPLDKRRHARADFAAWLAAPAWRPPRPSPSGAIDSHELAAAEALLRGSVEGWLAADAISETQRAGCIAEEQAMLAVQLESIETIVRERGLDETSSDRLRRRVNEHAEIRLGRRGNPFFPAWARPRPIGAAAIAERLAAALRGDALLRAIAERAAIELRELERDPRTARFRRLLVDSQIDAAANRIDELAARTLDEADPTAARVDAPAPRAPRAATASDEASSPPSPTLGFDALVERLLAGAPPGTRR